MPTAPEMSSSAIIADEAMNALNGLAAAHEHPGRDERQERQPPGRSPARCRSCSGP